MRLIAVQPGAGATQGAQAAKSELEKPRRSGRSVAYEASPLGTPSSHEFLAQLLAQRALQGVQESVQLGVLHLQPDLHEKIRADAYVYTGENERLRTIVPGLTRLSVYRPYILGASFVD
jgi:hypothetical protein